MNDEIEINIRSLDTLNVVSGLYNALLYPILMKLLPDDLKQNSKLELLKFIKIEIQCRENVKVKL